MAAPPFTTAWAYLAQPTSNYSRAIVHTTHQKQEKRASYALGSASAGFAAPAQCSSRGVLVAAVQPAGAATPSLVLLQPLTAAGGDKETAAKSILDTQPQIKLPSALHSVHALAAGGGGGGGAVAVVLADGTVAGADFEHHKLRPLAPPAAAAGGATGAPAGRPTRGAAAGGAAAGSRGRPAAADAAGGCLAVAWQQEGGAVAVSFYGATKAHPFVEHLCSCEVAAPDAGARLLSLHLSRGGFAALWSAGFVSAHAFDYRAGGKQPPLGSAFALGVLSPQLGIDAAAATEAAAAAGGAAPGRKRKAAGAGAGAAPTLLAAALSDTQLLLAAVAPDAGGAQLHHAVVDSRYGCVLSSGAAALPGADAYALAAAPPQLVALHGGGEPGRVALSAGGCVFVIAIDAPRADLAGLLGRLAVGGAAAAGASSSSLQLPLVGGGQGAAPAATAARVTTSAYQLDVGTLVTGAVESQERQQEQAAGAEGGGGRVALLPSTLVAGDPDKDGLGIVAHQLKALLDARPASTSSSSGSSGGSSSAAAVALPAAYVKQLEAAVRALLHQLHAQAQGQGHPDRAPRHRRRRTSAAAQQLLGRAAEALADGGLWELLRELLAEQPLQSLTHAPRLLPLAAAAQQHELVAELARAAEDVPADALLGALLQMLGDDGGSGSKGAAAAAAARQAHRQRLRAAAQVVVDEAAAAAAASAAEASTGGWDGGARARAWLACARVAAAAVDGFAPREVCLHALAAVDADAVEVQVALQRLPARHVLRLLRYLAKWAGKFSDQPLEAAAAEAAAATAAAAAEEAAAGGAQGVQTRGGGARGARAPAVPAELRCPGWGQVLDWLRALLDAHLAKLAMMPAAAAPLRQLADRISGHAAATARLVPLRGVAEHMIGGGALPMVATAAASSYTVELLDLRVRSR